MVRRRLRSATKAVLPTNAELPILDVLWELGEGTVQDVVDRLPSDPGANYKTVQSLLRIMENKGFVEHKTRGRAFVFISRVTRDEVRGVSVERLLDRNFQGSYAAMLVNLLDRNHVKEKELNEIEALIQRYREQKTTGESSK
jgi:BlaI family transcriptional regulator, penicillinase repressor